MPGLIVRSETPFNAETPLHLLRDVFTTSQRDFYVRSHGSVPNLNEETYHLAVRGRVDRPLDLSLDQLRSDFPRRAVMAVMQCAGNRRADLHEVRPVMGDPWSAGAIGNALWGGVSLVDVLRAAGAETDAGLHVAFDACDSVAEGGRFGVSIPMTKAHCPDVVLAFAMNDEALAPEHGFPLRVVVPGFAGVRSPKWLAAITVQDAASDNAMQQTDYKMLPPKVTRDTVDWAEGITINEMPLNSAICVPADGADVRSGPVPVRGYAMASGRGIERVDVSADGGRSWVQAALQRQPEAPWSWTFWETEIVLPAGEHELAVRAWDSAGQTQPAAAEDVWNFKGYLCAVWHRVRVQAG
ncbi:molybdopterin-dependent oxidoreductase [Rhodopila sp.]|uniref:molybdopterin-dependent oxidoreductase n=1 Tax=Rhodopila sp. TaxID=2480087 RepID=UPI003D125ACD